MIILGLNAYHGDSSAAIFKDGVLVAAIEEERIRRIKHWAGFPSEAVRFCLNEANVAITEVDHITISRDPYTKIIPRILHILTHRISIKAIWNRLENRKKIASLKDELALSCKVDPVLIKAKIHSIEHHRSHLASAFFASPYEEAAILSIDGFGDFSSTMTAVGKNNQFTVLDSVSYPHSLGVFYTMFTQFLGFKNYGDEYKVMGLAPYGSPSLTEQLWDVIQLTDDGLFKLNEKYFRHPNAGVEMSWEGGEPTVGDLFTDTTIQMFGPLRAQREELTQYHKDLAASVQRVCEETIFHILTHLHKRTGLKNITIAGGVAQNSVANGKILANTPFENLYIPPAGHDAGTAIGSALYFYHQVLGNPRSEMMSHSYFGSQFSDQEIEQYLQQKGVSYQSYSDTDLFEKISECLINGGVVGWFQGRAEFGPRALGHRSIIADPRRNDAKELLNVKIKRREAFRPFAPSILKEHVGDFFNSVDDVPFMEKVFTIKKEQQSLIPAVTHVDGTGRLQTVDRTIEPKYYGLIERFYQKTNIPILLNTSFNENEPIVNTPEEAYACFARTKMDIIVMGNIVVER